MNAYLVTWSGLFEVAIAASRGVVAWYSVVFGQEVACRLGWDVWFGSLAMAIAGQIAIGLIARPIVERLRRNAPRR